MSNSNSPNVKTFGCRLNSYESEVIKSHLTNAGVTDVIVFNTCAVTQEAERQVKQAIRKAHRENPEKRIIVTGCASQISPEIYANMEGVDSIIGNDAKLKPSTWEQIDHSSHEVQDILEVKDLDSPIINGFEGRARAIIQIQQGCDHRCTFCIIPYGRGNSRSVPIDEITDQIKNLVKQGFKEIVLTGVDITSYGHDLPSQPSLGLMIRRVLNNVPSLPRLRLSSIDPVEIDEELWTLIESEKRLMPYLHLSVQAGDDMILKRMKRRHLRDDILNVCQRARSIRPDIAFGADIIAGFPTESEQMFQNTLSLISECDLTFLHVFPYSERPGTPAAKMPQIDKNIRKQRASKLRQAGEKQLKLFLTKQMGKTLTVIVENDNFARTENFMRVKLNKAKAVGSLEEVTISGVEKDYLLAHA